MSNPFFTIILPNYKTEYFLEETLMSIKRQTFQDFECILINDGSPGINQQEIAQSKSSSIYHNRLDISNIPKGQQCQYIFDKLELGSQFTILHQDNQGQAKARNTALKEAKGQIMLFLDCDDYFEVNHLQLIYDIIKPYDLENQDYLFYFEDFTKFRISNQQIEILPGPTIKQRSKNFNLNNCLVYNQAGTTYCATSRRLFDSNQFSNLTKIMEDVEIINRFLITAQNNKKQVNCIKIPITTTIKHRSHETSQTTIDASKGMTQEKIDFINMFNHYLSTYDLTIRQRILCYLGIYRAKLNPETNKFHKYPKKVLTLITKLISGWYL